MPQVENKSVKKLFVSILPKWFICPSLTVSILDYSINKNKDILFCMNVAERVVSVASVNISKIEDLYFVSVILKSLAIGLYQLP